MTFSEHIEIKGFIPVMLCRAMALGLSLLPVVAAQSY
jgi:hypothetical protein